MNYRMMKWVRGNKGSHWRMYEWLVVMWVVYTVGIIGAGVLAVGTRALKHVPNDLVWGSFKWLMVAAVGALVFDKYNEWKSSRECK